MLAADATHDFKCVESKSCERLISVQSIVDEVIFQCVCQPLRTQRVTNTMCQQYTMEFDIQQEAKSTIEYNL